MIDAIEWERLVDVDDVIARHAHERASRGLPVPMMTRDALSELRDVAMPFWLGLSRHVHRIERASFAEHVDIGGEG